MVQQNLQQLESHAVVQSSRPNEGTHTENTSGFQLIGNSRGVTQHRVCPFCSGDHFMMNCTGFQQSLQAHNTDVVAQVSARQSASNTFSSRAPERTLSGGSRSSENLLKSPPVSPFCKISKEYLESPMHMEGGETISVGSFLGQFSRPAPEEVHIFNFFDNALLPLINISFAFGCYNNSSKKIAGITFHRFPKEEILRKEWLTIYLECKIPVTESRFPLISALMRICFSLLLILLHHMRLRKQ
ncbi:hypothetical protein JTE90_019289 [Oedothorax gibbosus]|uniref:Uncharacterized protein n=1 Tax=Oedothorax gibbosus TaxID=931172 RepID=A0AAV6UV84_9ARAC|nr:hypothetical protein JTE90_019289 [Oedothorax gibbosus]